jgi:predicted phage tail protein
MAAADGKRKVGGQMGNVFTNRSYELYNLPSGDYEWTVQAINGAYRGGAFAETKTFTIAGGSSTNEMADRSLNIFSQDNKLIVKASDNTATGQIQVYAISGNLVAAGALSAKSEFNLSQGVYIVKVMRDGYRNVVSRVIVQ